MAMVMPPTRPGVAKLWGRFLIALGRALIRKPGLFLLDEPLSSLDAMLRIELRAELKRLQRDMGATFLLATPDFAESQHVFVEPIGRFRIANGEPRMEHPPRYRRRRCQG